ncbi:multidrug effflux MFS transporter [Pseudobacteriovorax antillogorgiicola]|uniref:MFS transporter, DHA1 family, bicyclomycin/chloramphenicol resistance protein n=1 Tax=Pseudobacteriovorax antillogorgiicola TaxID=1513793 RepID=A0A1Y6CMC2_9BACT|nr:multidrug effflux MFS transporter [Pseudobacteriovorax antillogorgiicola]TCS44791.1 DHA1 family bicyclomycin/chloramphenicol resistance-like MFS transporter [Pseudobacteriovorax antillogorgiicola]SMF77429.1 MFS transporter, DHA1 family, bicyclomycin/chloramphenicol resistance protein [Pseudobacteriovorax antillogorgiicola]
MKTPESAPSSTEFVVLMASLMSLVALSIDTMLPALDNIGRSLQITDPKDSQFIISTVFLGMGFGLVFYGPFGDTFGRKKSIYLGVAIFAVGSLISLLSESLPVMLCGRFLQGFGGSSCRIMTMAMIRDRYSGRDMARVVSLIMMIFILVPVLAPTVGQGILFVGSWRTIFGLFLVMSLLTVSWLAWRQPETLKEENRKSFNLKVILSGFRETILHPKSRAYTITAGVMFGGFVGYLSLSQQLLQVAYGLDEMFSVYFGAMALAVGFSSFANSRLVMLVSMEKLCATALLLGSVISAIFFTYAYFKGGLPRIEFLTVYFLGTFFSLGLLFGNLNAMAVEPLGHIAGTANSVISSIQTLISVVIGTAIGSFYEGNVLPIVGGFFACTTLSLIVILTVKKESSSVVGSI